MMDKKQLQHTILENAYNRVFWLDVLQEFFGVKKIHVQPHNISVDNNKAEYAVELGSFYTVDEKLVGIFEVKLQPQVWIERNRVGLRSLLRQVYKYDVDGALIVFVQDHKWRFSYISEIRTEEGKKETEPKRYTYLFGKGEICRTAADRFDKLKDKPIYLNDLFEAFSVEKLNRDFFKTYKEFYERFWKYLNSESVYRHILIDNKAETDDLKQKPIRDFVKKLLGRIVFLQFLQKKGWLGADSGIKKWEGGDIRFLQNLFAKHLNKEKFHSIALRTLFFETLNTKRKNDIAPSSLGSGIKLPYLNGGLFDKDISFEHDIDFPSDYFKNLLDFFEQYNFTIDENDPYDSEVGIDPEMLGHIFENLLEENKDRGAFYTPKEVVHYMCQESLKEYLFTQLPGESREEIEALVSKNEVSITFTNFKKANELNEKLKAVKICDPAIGSGAFPMGLLKEIFECRRMLYAHLKTSKAFDPAKVKKEIIQQNIYGVDLENGAVEIARLRFWLALVVDELEPQPLPNLDYKIMQGNSLLESFAHIDLSNLISAGDEIMVEEQTQLILGDEFEAKPKQLTVFTKANKEHLYLLIKKYFDPDEWEKQTGEKIEKVAVKREINDFVEGKIHAHVLKQQRILKDEVREKEKKWRDAGIKDFEKLNHKSKEYKQYTDWIIQLEHLDETEEKLIALQKTEDKPYFLWRLWFKDVFDKGGFDIVIGNPPYINLQRGSADIGDFEAANYQTFSKTGDIYCLFYEQGNNLLKSKGTLCYITSNKWMNAAYGKKFRKYLLQETNPTLLIDFSKTVIFPAAVVFVNILKFKKENNRNVLIGVRAQADFQIGKTDLYEYVLQNSVQLSDLNEDNWAVAEKQDFEITKRIDEIGTPLRKWNVQFYAGIKTAMNPAFHINADTRLELVREDQRNSEIIKPMLRGKDIKRWVYHYQNLYLINAHNGIREKNIPRIDVVNDYPTIYEYLQQFYDKNSPRAIKNLDGTYQTLKNRADQGEHWTNLRNCAYLEEFEKEKIVWIEISDRANYCMDTEGYYLTNSAYFLTGDNLKFLLAVLNSRLMDFYFYQKTAQIAGGRKRYTKQYVELLPIPQITDSMLLQKFETIVDYLIFLNKADNPPVNPYTDNSNISPVFENVLNMMVYELYYESEMKTQEIDVLRYVDTQINFPEIISLKSNPEKQADIVGKVYKWLQEQENPIRNRIILSNIKSKNIIRRIISSTH